MYVCIHVCMYVYMYVCMYVCVYVCMYAYMYVCMDVCMYAFTTRTPTVTDVFVSGRNVGALRPGRRVPFRSLAPGIADDI